MTEVYTEYVNNSADTAFADKWWNADAATANKSLFGLVRYVEKNQAYRSALNLRYARLYSNTEILGLSSGTYARTTSNNFANNRVTLNVVKSCVDTAASKISKNKPRPLFLTENGDYNLKHKAKLLNQYMEGMFDETDIYRTGQRVFTDACVFGTGCLKLYIDPASKKIKAERIFIDEIIIDDIEGMYGTPTQIHQRKYYDRDQLIKMFPDKEEQIKSASTALRGETATQSTANNVIVVESWHLPSSKDAKDGKHAICVDNATLIFEDYDKNFFPFVFFRWTDKLVGFWGMGLAEELIGIQLEINKVLRNIQQAQQLMAVPRVFVDVASNIVGAHITNDIGGIIKYQGTPPTFQSPNAMNPEVYQYVDTLYKRAYEITGISLMSAQAKKPEGLNSGVAIREFDDIASERFVLTSMRYEDFYMEAARQILILSKELYEIDPKLTVKAQNNKFIRKIKWKEVNMDEDEFSMKIFPVSLLPTTPAGKLQTVQELVQAGLIDQDRALALLDFPDLEGFLSLRTAAQDNIERILGIMMEEGRYIPPEPFMNLQLALEITQETYLKARCDNLEEDKLELLRTFMDDIQTLLAANAPPMPTAPPLGGPVAPGLPPAPSDLSLMQGQPLPPPGV